MIWSQVLACMMRLQLWAPDVATEEPIARAERLRTASIAIAAASSNRELAAALLTVAEAETRLAKYVGEDRCLDGPRGAQCDRGRDGLPRARSYWQLQRSACAPLWELPPGDERATYVAAQCAARLLRWGRQYCGSWAGSLSVYGGRRCKDPIGVRRAARMQTIRSMLDQF